MAMMPGGRGASAEMNVTPLIDVLLVLIIIFMILPHHSVGERAQIPQKSADPAIPSPEPQIVIQVQQAGEGQPPNLKINEQKVSRENLEGRLREIFAPRMNKVAFVKGDPEVEFQYVGDVVDITQHAGAMQIGLLGNE